MSDVADPSLSIKVASIGPGEKNLILIRSTKAGLQEDLYAWATELQKRLGLDNVVVVLPKGVSVEVVPISVETKSEARIKVRKGAEWSF